MRMRFSELACKEVVCITDGSRLGFVSDVELDICSGTITAIIVPCRGKLLGLANHQQDYVIPFKCIKRIGEDIILVDVSPNECRVGRQKNPLFR